MSAPIGPGDWVERITPSPENGFVVGNLYQLARVTEPRACGCGTGLCPGVLVVGWPMPKWHPFFASCAFRLVYRPKADAFNRLLEVTDACDGAERVREGKLRDEPSNLPQAIVDDQMERAA